MSEMNTQQAARIRFGILADRYTFEPERLTLEQNIFLIECVANGEKYLPGPKRSQLEYRGYLHAMKARVHK